MSKQKFVVFLIAIIGMIATFLPWYEIGSLGMIMGYQTVGWSTFIMFALVFLFGLRKEVKQDMSMGLLYLGSFFSLLAAFVVLWQMITLGLDQEGGSMSVAGNTLANDTRVLYGAYQIRFWRWPATAPSSQPPSLRPASRWSGCRQGGRRPPRLPRWHGG